MNRRDFTTAALASLCCARTFAQTLAAAPTHLPSDQEADTYAIYSTVLRGCDICKCQDPAASIFLIEDTTFTPSAPVFVNTLPPPRPYTGRAPGQTAAEFDQQNNLETLSRMNGTYPMTILIPDNRHEDTNKLLASFQQHQTESFQLSRHFDLPLPYRLLTATEKKQYYSSSTPIYFSKSPDGTLHQDNSNPYPVTDPQLAQDISSSYDLDSFSPVYFNPARTLALVAVRNSTSTSWGTQWHVYEKNAGQWARLKWPSSPDIVNF
jgi:hypothetical protein